MSDLADLLRDMGEQLTPEQAAAVRLEQELRLVMATASSLWAALANLRVELRTHDVMAVGRRWPEAMGGSMPPQ